MQEYRQKFIPRADDPNILNICTYIYLYSGICIGRRAAARGWMGKEFRQGHITIKIYTYCGTFLVAIETNDRVRGRVTSL